MQPAAFGRGNADVDALTGGGFVVASDVFLISVNLCRIYCVLSDRLTLSVGGRALNPSLSRAAHASLSHAHDDVHLQGMIRRAWRPVAGSVLVVGTSSIVYRSYFSQKAAQETFPLQVRERDANGNRVSTTKNVPMLTMAEVNERLARYATQQEIFRPGGLTWKSTTAQLASNDPIEDAHAAAIVERDPLSSTPEGDFVFYSVMDGHGGPYTSKLLARILIPAVALQLHNLTNEPSTFTPKTTFLDTVKSYITNAPVKPVPFDADPTYISLAIQTAFAMVDSEIVNAPLRLIKDQIENSKSKEPIPDLSKHPMALPAMLPALSGEQRVLILWQHP